MNFDCLVNVFNHFFLSLYTDSPEVIDSELTLGDFIKNYGKENY